MSVPIERYELYGETKREIISLSEMSDNIKNAVLATEDSRFYSHHGVDIWGVFAISTLGEFLSAFLSLLLGATLGGIIGGPNYYT